jgi:hypothetical protein
LNRSESDSKFQYDNIPDFVDEHFHVNIQWTLFEKNVESYNWLKFKFSGLNLMEGIVFDFGSCTTRAGFSGDDAPRAICVKVTVKSLKFSFLFFISANINWHEGLFWKSL